MWLMTPFGFFSIVCATGDGEGYARRPHNTLRMIRARNRAHLEALRQRWPGLAEIKETKDTDYPYRVFADRALVARIMVALAEDLDYTNFKKEAEVVGPNDHAYHHFLHAVWAEGLRMGPPKPQIDYELAGPALINNVAVRVEVLPKYRGGWAVRDRAGAVYPIRGKHKTEEAAMRAAAKQKLTGTIFNIYE